MQILGRDSLIVFIVIVGLLVERTITHGENGASAGETRQSRKLTTLDGFVYHEKAKPEGARPAEGSQTKGLKPGRNKRPTAKPRPKMEHKKQVDWFEDTHYYALKASPDNRFRIRASPIPQAGSPWPLPQLYRPSAAAYPIDLKSFEFRAVGETCEILEYSFDRIRKNTFGITKRYDSSVQFPNFYSSSTSSSLRSLNVTVLKECDQYPSLDMDESYDLEIKKSGVSLIAREVWGALRGLETFSQLVYQDREGAFFINKTYIHDYPRFKHRGILLDTSRHFLRKETIIANLEAIAQNKMNVFHWHIVDDNSFPFQSKVYPNLTAYGAYDPVTHIYTHEDIAEIIEEARLRGIRVIPEFDTPGHTYSWGFGIDHLLTPCYDYKKEPDGFYGPINPILKSTYRLIKGLFTEVLSVFQDKYVHLGGDEVPFDCWSSNPYLLSFMTRNNLGDIRDLLNLYARKLLDIVTDIGSKREQGSGYIVWQEVFDNGVKLQPDTVVQVWSGDTLDIDRVTSAGYRAIFSSCWYLDYIGYGQDWDKYYRCEAIGTRLDDYRVKNQSLLIGGEACLWTEYADDEILMARLWPRASAAAERLWSDKHILDEQAAAPRIEEQRCRMLRRGLHVGVLSGPGYCQKYKQPKGSEDNKPFSFLWTGNSDKSDRQFSIFGAKGSADNPVYVVDVNAMYVVPLFVVVIVCSVAIVAALQDPHKNRVVAFLTCPISGMGCPRKGVRGLLFVFILFVTVWCIWSSPMWLNIWESKSDRSKLLHNQ